MPTAGNNEQDYQQKDIDQTRVDAAVAEKGVLRMRVQARVFQHVFQALAVQLSQPPLHLGAYVVGSGAGRQVEYGVAQTYQAAGA